MNYKEFVLSSTREDKLANDKTHFFSSLLSNQLAFLLFKIGFTPNSVTFLFLLLGISSGIFLIYEKFIFSYLFWRLHIIIDMADGIIARATSKFSRSAMGFDRSNHIIINLLFLFAVSSNVDNFVQYFLICSFLLSYLFSRNYFEVKQKTIHFSNVKIFLKNVVGLEGLVFFSTIGNFMFDISNMFFFVLVYGLFFIITFLLKLYFFIRLS